MLDFSFEFLGINFSIDKSNFLIGDNNSSTGASNKFSSVTQLALYS